MIIDNKEVDPFALYLNNMQVYTVEHRIDVSGKATERDIGRKAVIAFSW